MSDCNSCDSIGLRNCFNYCKCLGQLSYNGCFGSCLDLLLHFVYQAYLDIVSVAKESTHKVLTYSK